MNSTTVNGDTVELSNSLKTTLILLNPWLEHVIEFKYVEVEQLGGDPKVKSGVGQVNSK